jgi:oligopeptide transport system ATP-binding protein
MTQLASQFGRQPAASDPLLSITNVTKTFAARQWLLARSQRPVRAVDDISLQLRQGETLGLVGETGSGKSTLGRLVLRLIDPTSGTIRFDGTDITGLSLAEVRRMRGRIQMVFQDPFGSLDPRMTVRALVQEPMIVHGYPRSEIHNRAETTMRQVGLDPRLADRYPHEFSGGQRQRIGIARAMVLDPKLLVLDEPVSALDVSIQAQILNLLRDIQRRTNIAYLFIAHDLAVVRHISDRVAVMYLGRIVETGPRDALYGAPRHPYTVSLLSAVPVPDPARERTRKRVALYGEIGSGSAVPSGCRFHPRCFRARLVAAKGTAPTTTAAGATLPTRCVHENPDLKSVGGEHFAACHFPAETAIGLAGTT